MLSDMMTSYKGMLASAGAEMHADVKQVLENPSDSDHRTAHNLPREAFDLVNFLIHGELEEGQGAFSLHVLVITLRHEVLDPSL